MIKEFAKAWNKNKDILEEKIKTTEINDYTDLLVLLIEEVINPEMDNYEKLDTEKITVIDNGDYQGTQIYLIPQNTYQPSVSEYVVTHNYYGSCSSCDALLAAIGWGTENKDIKALMNITLHLLQRMKWLDK
ncbi:MAG: hypothetical protein K9K32_07450 [Halanaerobiales bacterium]|nr:hypothetical protein [Halanaerobiales bacterium]